MDCAPSLSPASALRTLALVGHPNVGKSVLFHRLTGAYVNVSNYPGTTVEVTQASIDALYARGIAAGALGGKLLGAGGGGFLVFYVEPEHQAAVRQAMQELLYIPFRFENGGTRVIYYAPEEEPAL